MLQIGGNSLPPLKEPVTDISLLFERAPLLESLRVLASERVWLSCYRIDRRVSLNRNTANLKHLFEVLGWLEACAGRLACERASDAEISEIRRDSSTDVRPFSGQRN